jgi:hypothetical protein
MCGAPSILVVPYSGRPMRLGSVTLSGIAMLGRKLFIAIAMLAGLATGAGATTPCSGVDRSLTQAQKPVLASAAARQMGLSKVELLESFHLDAWRILYVSTGVSDNAFLFYGQDPTKHKYVTLWAGAAMASEEDSINSWVVKNAPGIPAKLAACFAWHVTKDRDQ